MKHLDTFFFDMGNTLLDFHAQGPSDEEKDEIGNELLLNHINQKYKLNIQIKEYLELFWLPYFNYTENVRKIKLKEFNIIDHLKNFLQYYQIKITDTDAVTLLKKMYSPYSKNVVVNEYALEGLKFLKEHNKKIGVIGNGSLPDNIFIDSFKSLGLDKYIDKYTFSYNSGSMKPLSEIFSSALQNMNSLAENSVMIGDNIKTDIIGAKKCGLKTCYYNIKGITETSSEIDYEIKSFKELTNLAKQN